MLSTILKAGHVLNLFTHEQPEWGVSQMAKALGLSKSSLHDLVASLAQIGLLRRTDQGRYRLGWRMLTFSQILLQTTQFRCEARRGMEQLAAKFGETVQLATLDNDLVVYVDKLQGAFAMPVPLTHQGVRLHGHCTGLGKVLFADRPWAEVLQIVSEQGMPAFTPNTITTLEGLQAELQQVSQQGYAYDQEERELGMSCIAAPIRDYSGWVIAAMSMTMPAKRFQQRKKLYQRAMLRTCQEISHNLGYFPQLMGKRKRRADE